MKPIIVMDVSALVGTPAENLEERKALEREGYLVVEVQAGSRFTVIMPPPNGVKSKRKR